MKKKVLAMMMAGLMAVSLAACGSTAAETAPAEEAEEAVEEADEEAAEEAEEEATEEEAEPEAEEETEGEEAEAALDDATVTIFIAASLGKAFEDEGMLLDMYNARADAWKRIYLGNVTVHEPTNRLNRYTTEVNTDMFEAITNKTVNSPLGGVLQIRREHGVTYLDYLAENDLISTQGIEFGKNLLSIAQDQNAENVFTVILPYGNEIEGSNGRVNIESVNDGLPYIKSQEGLNY